MCKKTILLFWFVVLLSTVFGCGGSDSDDPLYDTGTLMFYNDTSLPISSLYLTPSDASSWGADQLDDDLHPGEHYTMTGIAAGYYDVKATIIGEWSTYNGYIYDNPIEAWHTYPLYAYDSDFTGSMEIINDAGSSYYIEGVYVSPRDASTWGPNQITQRLAPGESVHLFDLPQGFYDVWVVWNTAPVDVYYYDREIVSLTLLTLYAD